MKDFVGTLRANADFMEENGVTMVFSTSVISQEIGKQIVFGKESEIAANLCALIIKLRKDLIKSMVKILKKIK